MIDTIVVKFNTQIDDQQLVYWEIDTQRKPNGRFTLKYLLNETLNNGAMIKFTYFPVSYSGIPLLLVEFSIPHVVFGNNINMNYDINQAVDYSNAVISRISGIPEIDLWEGTFHRLDICYNHYVSDLVPHFIKALQSLEFTRRATEPYSSQGVQYRNNQKCSKFYDKEKECESPEAKGYLRQETTLHKEAIKKFIGKEEPTLKDISRKKLADALRDDLRSLSLLGNSIGTSDTTLEILCKEYGDCVGFLYFGYLQAKSKTNKKDLIVSTSSHPRTMNRRLQKIIQAGIPLTLTENINPLPPLYIEEIYEISSIDNSHLSNSICPKVLSDTQENPCGASLNEVMA